MPTLSHLQVPPPKTWQDFETLCCDFWRAIWKDPNAKKNGRQGQEQYGVDVYGNPNQQALWAGVQCKGKDNYTDKKLTEDELRAETDKAKSFIPKLSHFTMATTGPRDAVIQRVDRMISDSNRKAGLFTVDVWSWEDIVEKLEDHPEVVARHYPDFALTATMQEGFDQIRATQRDSLLKQAEAAADIKAYVSKSISDVECTVASFPNYLLASVSPLYDSLLDLARRYLDDNMPAQALDYLEQQKRLLWSSASPHVKCRLLMATGVAHLRLANEQRAAELFLEAVQYDPNDEKTICNAAVGYMILEDLSKASELVQTVLARNPANSYARSLLIQASLEPLNEVVSQLPEYCIKNQEIAFALGALAKKQGALAQAENWYRVACHASKDVSPDIKATLAQTIFERLQQEEAFALQVGQITDELRTRLCEVEQLLSEAWEAMSEERARRPRLSWLLTRGMVRRNLGKQRNARADAEEALRLDPKNAVAKYLAALLADDSGDTEGALILVKSIEQTAILPYTPLYIAELLRRSQGPDAAITHLNDCIKGGLSHNIESSARQMLVELSGQKGELDTASRLCNDLLQTEPCNVGYLVTASELQRQQGVKDAADATIGKAIRCVSPSTPKVDVLMLADELYIQKRFDEAALYYERVVHPALDTLIARRYLNSLYQASRLDKALEVCEKLREKNGLLRYVAEMEAAIFEETGDLAASRRVCEEYLEIMPRDARMRVQLALVHLRQRNVEAVDAFLADPPDWQSLPVDLAIQVANLLAVRERYRKSVELLYNIRRKHPEGRVHLRYIYAFLFYGGDKYEWVEADRVAPNVAVCVEDAAGKRQRFILEESEDARIEAGEITRSHRLWDELFDKQVGDSFLLKESTISPEQGKIVEIKSKYVYAFHECGETLQARYPEVKGFEAIRLPKDGDAGTEKLLDKLIGQHDPQRQALQAYEENQLPLGSLGRWLGRNLLEVWSAVVHNRETKLVCCVGAPEERRLAIKLLSAIPRPRAVVDPISLMTLDALGLRDEVIKVLGRLGIAQSTVDLLSDTIHKRKTVDRRGFMRLSKEGDIFVRDEVTAEEVENNLVRLQDLLRWIETNCDVLPWPTSLNKRREERQELSEVLGEESLDTILVAAGEGRIIYSDDLRLRNVAKVEFGVEGVWTQMILVKSLDSGVLSRERYDQAVISLVCSGYEHTAVDGSVLLAAARRAQWRPNWPYEEVVEALSGPQCDPRSAVGVAIDFIHDLWNEYVPPFSFDYLVLRLLDALAHQRSPQDVLRRVVAGIGRRFAVNPIGEREVMRLVNAWASLRTA